MGFQPEKCTGNETCHATQQSEKCKEARHKKASNTCYEAADAT